MKKPESSSSEARHTGKNKSKPPARAKSRAASPPDSSGPHKHAHRNLRRGATGASELEQLREELREARETLDALRNGEVDALVINGANGSQVYSLTGADQPYRIYVERMQEGAVTVSAEGLILYSNQLFADMVGQPLEQVISAQFPALVPPEAWAEVRRVLSPCMDVVKLECLIHQAGNGLLPAKLTACRLLIDDLPIICLVVTDLTPQRAALALRLAKERAEEASQAKDDFLAALSHELRTPLTPALLATTALEQDPSLPAAARATLSMIRRNVELEARLIDDLLDLTRITKGKLELQMHPVDVHDLISRALDICRADIRSHHLDVRLRLIAPRCHAMGDGVRLQQALWNVIRNAIKFTQAGGSIHIVTSNPEPDRLWIEVVDSGIGFAPETAATLFNAFEQGGRDVTRRFGGLGLGLAITRSIIVSHGGVIRAASRGTGEGATFTFDLPLIPAAAAPSRQPQAPAASGARGLPPLRILVVEDHQDTRESMTLLLRRSGHQVVAAGSAEVALHAAASQPPFDLVISDLGLPDMSGSDLMRELRARHQLQGIAVSGYGMEEDIRRSHDSGFRHHLTKPIRMDQLRLLLQEFQHEIQQQPEGS